MSASPFEQTGVGGRGHQAVVSHWIQQVDNNVQVCETFEFVKSIGAMLRSFSRSALLARGIHKDYTTWLDGARPSPKYVLKNNMSLTNSKI